MNYKQLKELLDSKNILVSDVIDFIGYTRAGFMRAVDNDTIELRKLKLLCDFVGITPALFFETGTYNDNHKLPVQSAPADTEHLEKEIEYLKQQIADKNEIIDLYREKNNPYAVVAENTDKSKLKEYGK